MHRLLPLLTLPLAFAACEMPERAPPRPVVQKAPPTPLEEGEKLWSSQLCAACHSLDGTPRSGPSLHEAFSGTAQLADGTTVARDEAYVRESLLQPNARITKGYPPVMPAYGGRMNERQIESLLVFLRSRTGASGVADAAPEAVDGTAGGS